MHQDAAQPRQPMNAPLRVTGGATLSDGELRACKAGGRSYVIARIGAKHYACANRCPHFGIRLSEGRLTGEVLECRWHHWRFNLCTGSIDAAESAFATFETFDVAVDGADLLIATQPRTRLRRLPVQPAAGQCGRGDEVRAER